MSEKPAVLVCRKLPEAVQARLARDYRAEFNDDDHVFSDEELLERSLGKDAIVACHSEPLKAAVIEKLPKELRIVANFSVGYDHVDVEAANRRGLVVTNTPDVLSDATAEIAMLCLLGAARRASEGERMMRSGSWKSWSPAFMVGVQITGKRLGILGMGRVGQVVAKRARGFEMEVHYHNRRRLPADSEQGAIFHETIQSLFAQSQVLSLNCPANQETRGILNRNSIEWLPDGAIVINTARGALVDDDALVAALKSGRVRAAGLDVFNDEPNFDRRYAELENTFLLPHIGSATEETRDAMGFRALDNLDAFFAGKEPRDRVA